jgi:SAM-dependent methyltransferase
VPESSSPHVFSDEYYDRLARLEEQHWWSSGMRAIQRELLDRLTPHAHERRVLDAGCGTGLTLTWARQFTSREPVGLDYAAAGLRYCQTRGHRRLVQGDAMALPFASNHFDLVLSCDVTQHLPRPDGDRRALGEIARVLAPGGYFLLRTNSRCGYPAHEPELDYRRYTRDDVRAVIAASGLEIVRLSYVNFLPALATTVLRRLKGQGASGTDPGLRQRADQPALVRRALYATLAAEGRLIAAAGGVLPFGHSIVALAKKS